MITKVERRNNGYNLTPSSLALTTISDNDLLGSLARVGTETLNLLDDLHALHHLSEHHVLPVQPLGLGGAEEELGAIGVGARVSHGQDARPGVLQREVLILELVAVDGLASGSVAGSEVSALAHEVGNHAVEGGALVAVALLPGAQGAEILAGPRNNIVPQLHDNLPKRNTISGDVEENFRYGHFTKLVTEFQVEVRSTQENAGRGVEEQCSES